LALTLRRFLLRSGCRRFLRRFRRFVSKIAICFVLPPVPYVWRGKCGNQAVLLWRNRPKRTRKVVKSGQNVCSVPGNVPERTSSA
jgi:hypothetical protein